MSCKAGGAAAISTVAIGRDRIAVIAAPRRVAIYNGDPTRSLKIAYFKWSKIGEDAEDRRLVRSYVLGRNFDNHGSEEHVKWSSSSEFEEELVIQRLEIAKSDLQQIVEKEVRGNAILQTSLERRKQALQKRRLELEKDVSKLQEQLQAVMDMRAAIEVQDKEW